MSIKEQPELLENSKPVSASDFTWIGFYTEFADRLTEFETDRKKLIEKIKKVFSAIGLRFPTMEKDIYPVDIDPFTVFGLFNKGITDNNRRMIIK